MSDLTPEKRAELRAWLSETATNGDPICGKCREPYSLSEETEHSLLCHNCAHLVVEDFVLSLLDALDEKERELAESRGASRAAALTVAEDLAIENARDEHWNKRYPDPPGRNGDTHDAYLYGWDDAVRWLQSATKGGG